jgi:hypothetical protein
MGKGGVVGQYMIDGNHHGVGVGGKRRSKDNASETYQKLK